MLALEMIEECACNTGITVIASDNRSLFEALMKNNGPVASEQLAEVRVRLDGLTQPTILQWVPSHVGLPRNELADQEPNSAAGRGRSTLTGDIAPPPSRQDLQRYRARQRSLS